MPADKYIYFPDNRKPKVIFVREKWVFGGNEELMGCEGEKDLEDGRFAFYPARRCQPYTEDLWAACAEWVGRRETLEWEYEQLMKKGVMS